MPFPEVTRVIYKKNPLDQVVCQLRFSPILKIDSQVPADFQERVRHHFQNYAESAQVPVEMPAEVEPFQPVNIELIQQAFKASGIKNYEFSTEDGIWKINLTRSFIALTTIKYERWEQFKEMLQIPLNALVETYNPDGFTRIGLRYIDVFRRSKLGLSSTPWEELLQPYILGILGASKVGSHVKDFESKFEIELENNESDVRIVSKFVKALDTNEICYMIDSDFYSIQKTPVAQAISHLDFFNTRSSRLIQWCITQQLHNAMEPELL